MFAFSRKKLCGSYCALMAASRAMFSPYALAARALTPSSACPVKFVYVVPVEYGLICRKLSRTHAMLAALSAGFSQFPSTDDIQGAERSAYAVSVAATLL